MYIYKFSKQTHVEMTPCAFMNLQHQLFEGRCWLRSHDGEITSIETASSLFWDILHGVLRL